MDFRKYQADLLFTGRQMLPSTAVLIMDSNGKVITVADEKEAGDDIRRFKGILCPGFVNTHCHLELSHMKGRIDPGTGLVPFVTRVIRERALDDGKVIQAMEAAEAELINSGTVGVGDICNTAASFPIKKEKRLQWRNFIEVMGFTEDKSLFRYEQARNILKVFAPLGRASLTPHAPYSVSRRLFALINDNTSGDIISIHNQESRPENRLYEENSGEMFELYRDLSIDASSFVASGKSSLQTYLPWLDRASNILLVHNTYASEADILFALSPPAMSAQVFFCICVNANRYIEAATPPVDLLRKHQARIIMGTDSYASNWRLNMLEEIKAVQRSFDVPISEVLQWATLNGAVALKLDDKLGSFDAGKQPGVVLIDKVGKDVLAPDAQSTPVF